MAAIEAVRIAIIIKVWIVAHNWMLCAILSPFIVRLCVFSNQFILLYYAMGARHKQVQYLLRM